MYQVKNYDTDKRLKSCKTLTEAQEDAQRRANRYHKPYAITWYDPEFGPVMLLVQPSN